MRIVVNGTERDVGEDQTVAGLVRDLGLEKQPCAVEVNNRLIRKAEHEQSRLRPGDRVEVVTLVGGG